mgnify:CR=1 FL=1
MSVKIGTKDLLAVNVGNSYISQIYYGSNLIWQNYFVKITFYFDDTTKAKSARGKLCNRAKQLGASWYSTSDPHVWYVITPLYTKGAGGNDDSLGIGRLFCGDSDAGLLLASAVGTCQVTSIEGDYDKIETLDRLFQKCTAITSISKTGFYDKFLTSTNLINVNSICNDCTNITDGSSLNGYNVLSQVSSIMTHASTFTNADSTANLDQIPVGWGGNMIPASTPMTSSRVAYSGSNYTGWRITGDNPDWNNIIDVFILTTASVSTYAGVSMNRSRIPNTLNGLKTATGNALYFYPAFVQCSKIPGQSGNSVSWLVATENPNGSLTASQGNTDMAGTLDFSTYGPFMYEYGTYDSTKDVYFVFLVTNTPIDSSWAGLSAPMAFLYNTNFKADAGLRWFE